MIVCHNGACREDLSYWSKDKITSQSTGKLMFQQCPSPCSPNRFCSVGDSVSEQYWLLSESLRLTRCDGTGSDAFDHADLINSVCATT